MSDKHYVIDWDKVQTPDDIKRLLAVIDFAFLPDCPGIGNVMDLVVLRDKNPNDLVFTKLEPDKAPGGIVRMDAEGRWSWGRVPSAPLIIDSGSGAVGESMPTHILEVREEEMTKRYTTDELIEKLYDHWKYKAHAEGMMHHNEYRDAIVERLKAADELCEAAKLAEESQGWDGNNPDEDRWSKLYAELRNAIAKFREA